MSALSRIRIVRVVTERPAAAGAALAFGIVVALVWLEVFLRAGAAVYVRQMASSTGAFSRRDALKVLCVGDSFTFGIGAPTGESYPDRLERILNDRLRDGRAEVVNLGLPGKNSAEILWVVRKELNSPKIPPDVLVLAAGVNDQWNHHWLASLAGEDPLEGLDRAVSGLRVYRFVKIALGRGPIRAGRFFAEPREAWDSDRSVESYLKNGRRYADVLKANLKAVVALARERNVRPYLLRYHDCRHPVSMGITEAAAESNAPLIDAWKLGMSRNALDTFVSEDGWHPNAEGYAIVARLVADSLLPDLDVALTEAGKLRGGTEFVKGESVPRVVVFGMDGADPDLIFPWARAGYLPNIARLMREGAFGRLESTTHPLTPQAWTSMTTGVNPGRHGIFDFGMREDGSYAIRLATSRDRLAPTMFEMLPEPLTCAALNIPLSFPVDPVRGYAVGGMHTPALDTPGAFYPPDLAHALDGYVIDTMVHWYDDKDRFVADVRSMLEARHAAYLRLFDHRPVDLFFAVYVALDRVQHAFWHELTADHRANPGTHTDHGEAIFDIARRLDGCLGDYMERLRPEDHLLLVSDHGFGDLQGDVYLNAWLVDNGFLSFDPQKVRAFQPPPLPEGDDPRHAWHRKLHRGDPTPLPNDDDIRAGRIDPRYKTWDTVDWTRTRAYASGLFGNLWINLRGREPHGAVDPGREYEEVRDDLLGRLSELRHPEDGEPLVTMAARREDLYWGRALERAPDIIVAFRDYAYMTRGATEFFSGDVVGPVVVGHTGNHRLHGIVGLRGPAARRGEAKDSSITQIAATALHLLGAPVPANLDGGVAENLLHDDFLKTRPVIPGPAAAARTPFDPAAASPDMTRVLERLEGLGYLV